jgi:hypothetical protein
MGSFGLGTTILLLQSLGTTSYRGEALYDARYSSQHVPAPWVYLTGTVSKWSKETTMNFKPLVTATVLCVLTASAFAQDNIRDRKHDQQDRIGQGVHSGQLTPRETSHLERREGSVNREERNMRAHDDGRLTNKDRRLLNKRQNHISRSIYRDKHNTRHQGPA